MSVVLALLVLVALVFESPLVELALVVVLLLPLLLFVLLVAGFLQKKILFRNPAGQKILRCYISLPRCGKLHSKLNEIEASEIATSFRKNFGVNYPYLREFTHKWSLNLESKYINNFRLFL